MTKYSPRCAELGMKAVAGAYGDEIDGSTGAVGFSFSYYHLSDAIADILHLAVSLGLDPDEIHNKGWGDFLDDTNEADPLCKPDLTEGPESEEAVVL